MVIRGLAASASASPSPIDWDAPWFRAVAVRGRLIEHAPEPRRALDFMADQLRVCNARGLPIRFAAPDAAGASPYEAHIHATGQVPTRGIRHDLFNALVWLAFPRVKARLNALQAAVIACDGIGPRRGALRDAATLIDENAVLLVTRREDLVDAVAAHDWRRLFVAYRSAWRAEVTAVVFGHALMEKMTSPYPGITAHALPVSLDPDAPLAAIDAAVADALDSALAPTRLLPLPLLGIPGWAENEDEAFYDDASVFRPGRRASRSHVNHTRSTP